MVLPYSLITFLVITLTLIICFYSSSYLFSSFLTWKRLRYLLVGLSRNRFVVDSPQMYDYLLFPYILLLSPSFPFLNWNLRICIQSSATQKVPVMHILQAWVFTLMLATGQEWLQGTDSMSSEWQFLLDLDLSLTDLSGPQYKSSTHLWLICKFFWWLNERVLIKSPGMVVIYLVLK